MPQLSVPYTMVTAGCLGVAYAGLQLRVGLHRLQSKITFGNTTTAGAEDEVLTTKARAGGNMAEYVPIGMLLMLLMEAGTPLPPNLLAAYGTVFGVSRLTHAYALANAYSKDWDHGPYRKYSFVSTILSLVAAGGYVAFQGAKALRK
ncbi:hypothetical protein HYH02_004836 [Chlamydomonas schloesseri]|uniref:Uncharacterized protein n=1 Tax=Chlamydomonas schloesseri TaxID=2026947 RepID=A0A835WNV1_9CHLO|nr:hypothetical protein HYH02_004836 [Chlamydomonas schloesseri]|eukprot:KAG2450331.1 hypothetical protein HYH02_004836 [Chlamydomonas schloesseri]